MLSRYTLFTFILLTGVTALSQQVGDLDVSFANQGRYQEDFGFQDNLEALAIDNNGRIVFGGTAITPAFAGKLVVQRLLSDGQLDISFAENGTFLLETFTESYAYEIIVNSDNSIIIAGAAANPNYEFSGLLIKLDENGEYDLSFGNQGIVLTSFQQGDEFIYGAKLTSDERIVIAGKATNNEFNSEPFASIYSSTGALETQFGNNGYLTIPVNNQDNVFWDVSVQEDGKIIACGHYGNPITETGQTDLDILVVRFDQEGNLDSSFDDDGIVNLPVSNEYVESAYSIVTDNDGNIYTCGYTTALDFSFEAIVLGLTSTGQLRNDFGNNGVYSFALNVQNVFTDMVVDNDKLIMCGTSGGFFFDDRDFLLLRINSNGLIDDSFNSDGYILTSIETSFDDANAIAIQNDGKIVLAGKGNNGSNNDIAVTRHLNNQNVGIEEIQKSQLSIYPNPSANNEFKITSSSDLFQAIEVYQMDGSLIFQINHISTSSYDLTIPALPSGTYTAKIISDKNIITRKIIKL